MQSICEYCGSEFEQKSPYRSKWVKTCSYECSRQLADRNMKAAYEAKGKVQLVKTQCERCGQDFEHRWHKPQKFCSRECSNRARSGERHPAFKKAKVHPKCVVCGEPTMHTQRITCPDHRRRWTPRELVTCPCGRPAVSLKAKYCSDECRRKWGIKPAVRMVTSVCIGCGKEFSRPWFYASKMNYCSNKCSHSQRKKVRDKFVLILNDAAVVFHSSWEIRFWAACLRFDIPIRSYDGPDIQTSLGIYRPDFILGSSNVVVDVKGWVRPESGQKIAEARDQGIRVEMVNEEMLSEFEETGRWAWSPMPEGISLTR